MINKPMEKLNVPKRCKKCKSDMVEAVNYKSREVWKKIAIQLFVIAPIIFVISCILTLINPKFEDLHIIAGVINAMIIIVRLIGLETDSYVRYECPKCGHSVQHISLLYIVVDIISDIFIQ